MLPSTSVKEQSAGRIMIYTLLRTIAIYRLLWAVAAIPWPDPTATSAIGQAVDADGWSPKPTQDPLNYELFKREVGSRTCGYRDGKRSKSEQFL